MERGLEGEVGSEERFPVGAYSGGRFLERGGEEKSLVGESNEAKVLWLEDSVETVPERGGEREKDLGGEDET